MIGKPSEPGGPASLRLRCLPLTLKITVTLFLVLVAGGLAGAVAHTYFSYADADGHPSLTFRDLRIVLGGERLPNDEVAPFEQTRLWRAIHGNMRNFLSSRTDLEILEAWLRNGADEATFGWPWTTGAAGPYPAPGRIAPPGKPPVTQPAFQRAPAEIFQENCVACHNPGGEQWRMPLTGFVQVARYTTLPPAPLLRSPDTAAQINVMHAHLLTIPVFVLMIAILFYVADWPPGSPVGRNVITVLPALCVVGDVATTWLSQAAIVFVYAAVAVRALFLLGIAVQIIGALGGMWQRADRADPARTES